MSKNLITLLLLLATIIGQAGATSLSGNWNVIPLPQKVEPHSGRQPFALNASTTICYAKGDTVQRQNAELLASYIRQMTGLALRTTTSRSAGQISLALATLPGGDEAYRIVSSQRGLTLEGNTHAAVFHGMQTIMKALPSGGQPTEVLLPAAVVSDAPRYAYRGFMLDCGRHFFSVEYIKKFIDVLAMHNINYFHWHLTEDQGWRIEIKKYPRLTEIGSRRSETTLGHGTGRYDGKPVSGFYTQDDAREIVRYAAQRHITVIPEVDMPGHIQSALAAYPELGCTGGPYEVCRDFGVIREVMCAGQPMALQFAKDVIDEIMDIFPSPYIHIGGDECPKYRWRECARCQARIAQLGLKDTDGHSKEDQLQTWFMGEVQKEIRARGRQMLGWDEILDGTPSKDMTIIAWTSRQASVRSANEGHSTIVAPITNFYFSNPYINRITGTPSIQRVYDVNPTFTSIEPGCQANVIGAEGCIWTEWVADTDKLEWELLPRLAALCEVQWTEQPRRNLDDFIARLRHMQGIYRAMGLKYRDDILP